MMHVAGLWRYPVKSLAGEPLDRAFLERVGVPDDRRVRVMGPEGVRTARKHYRVLRLHGGLGADGRPTIDGHAWDSLQALALVRNAAGADAWLEACGPGDGVGILPLLVATDGAVAMFGRDVQYRLPVKVVILNNHFLGMVRQWQELFYEKRYSSTCLSCAPDFVKLAEAYGATGLRASRPDEMVPALERAFETPGPVVVEVQVSREENVYPMVPAGASLKKMILI